VDPKIERAALQQLPARAEVDAPHLLTSTRSLPAAE
jgi:hypothetical protein